MINGLTMFNTFRTSSIWQDIFLVDTDWNCATRITPFISALYLALHNHCWVSVCSPWASSLQSTYYHLFSFLLQLLLLSRFCLLFHLFCFFSGLLYFGTSLNLMSNLLLLLVTSIALLLTSCRSTKPITLPLGRYKLWISALIWHILLHANNFPMFVFIFLISLKFQLITLKLYLTEWTSNGLVYVVLLCELSSVLRTAPTCLKHSFQIFFFMLAYWTPWPYFTTRCLTVPLPSASL